MHDDNLVADGQKIAKRVSSQINKETRKLKKLVIDYNRDSILPEMTIQTALNPDDTTVDTDVRSTVFATSANSQISKG